MRSNNSRTCPECNAQGTVLRLHDSMRLPCERCEGKGYIPYYYGGAYFTPEEILSLMSTNGSKIKIANLPKDIRVKNVSYEPDRMSFMYIFESDEPIPNWTYPVSPGCQIPPVTKKVKVVQGNYEEDNKRLSKENERLKTILNSIKHKLDYYQE